MPDSLLQIGLIFGVLSLIHFQYWLNCEWRRNGLSNLKSVYLQSSDENQKSIL